MITNLNELNKKIEMINNQLVDFDTDERKEIKKNNKLINEYISELSLVKDCMLGIIKEKSNLLKPINNNELLVNDNLNLDKLLIKVKFLSNDSFVSKFGFDKCLHEIRYSGSLEFVNKNILEIIDKFKLINVNLDKEDFKYSLSLFKYMEFFFDNYDKENFDKLISSLFDSLYWECPDIVIHVYLSFMLLLDKNSDKFENYIKNEYENHNYNVSLSKYYETVQNVNDKVNCNEYLVYNKFLNGELRVEDYLLDSVKRREVVSKYVDYDTYVNYSLEDRNYFYEQINGMYLDLVEYLGLTKYKFLIDKIREIYLNKNSYTGNYTTMKKNIKNFDKQRDSLNKKVFSCYNKLHGKTSGLLFKKYNSLFNKANNKILEIIDIYNNYDEISFINDVVVKLNDDSTYYDVLKIYENNYSYLVKLLNDNNCNYDEFIDFVYSPYLNISKSIPFINNVSIKDKLINKYDLFDLNFNLDDDNKLKDELKYIVRLWHIEKGNIDVNKFKLIFDIDKIKEEI